MLSTQIQHLIIVRDPVLQQLVCFTNFCVVIYVPWWNTSLVAFEVTINKLNFIQLLFAYVNVKELCAPTCY